MLPSLSRSRKTSTNWFKLNDWNSLPHEYCLHYLLECHIFSTECHTGRHEQWKKVTWPLFFCSGPTTGASGDNVSPPTTGLQKDQKWSGVSVGFFFFFSHFFLNEPIAGTLRHAYEQFHATIWRSDCVGPILSRVYRPKLFLFWNQVIKGNYANCTLFRTKVHMATSALRDRPWNFAHVFYMSISGPDLRFLSRMYLV